uniref:Ubiquitin-like protease family profile domain-containing protein n=1 Tax=Ditylenchus dipsaci TaxID=166011 RepID=A0A915DDU0_9BILA
MVICFVVRITIQAMGKKKLNDFDHDEYDEEEDQAEEGKYEQEPKRPCLSSRDVAEQKEIGSKREIGTIRFSKQTASQSTDGIIEEDNTNNVVLGDMMPDDLMNIFCQRFSTSLNGRVEGMLAIQSITIEPEQCAREITGRRQVLQVLLDPNLPHYILVEWRSEERQVHIYDPLIRGGTLNLVEGRLSLMFRQQISTLFGHLFPGEAVSIPLVMQRQMQQQRDGWSCGLRAIGHLLLRAFNRNMHDFNIDLPKVLNFLVRVLANPTPTTVLFQLADLGEPLKPAKVRKNKPTYVHMDKSSLQLTLRELEQEAETTGEDSENIEKDNSFPDMNWQ